MPFSEQDIAALPRTLSAPRFATYLDTTGHDPAAALALYEWNAQIAASFLVPLHLFEICIRNAAANAIATYYADTWPWAPAFNMSLPDPYPPNFSPRRELMSVRQRHQTTMATGKVIADIKFAFWVSMFTRRHEGRLWSVSIRREFPHAPTHQTVNEIRQTIYDAADRLRILRNRIAHHEPIFQRDLALDYQAIRDVVGLRCCATLAWLGRLEEVSYMLANRPIMK